MAPHAPFNPDAATHLALLNDWMDSSLPLFAIAARYDTTIADLLFFFARPEITAQLSAMHAAAYDRARLAATTHLDSAISALALLVQKFLTQQANPDPTLTPEQQRRTEETGRRASTALLRFIKNKPAGMGAPTPRAASGTPALRAGSADSGTPDLRAGSSAFDPSTQPTVATEPPRAQQATPSAPSPTQHSAPSTPHSSPTQSSALSPQHSPSPPPSQPIQDFLEAHLTEPVSTPATNAPAPPSNPNEHWP